MWSGGKVFGLLWCCRWVGLRLLLVFVVVGGSVGVVVVVVEVFACGWTFCSHGHVLDGCRGRYTVFVCRDLWCGFGFGYGSLIGIWHLVP